MPWSRSAIEYGGIRALQIVHGYPRITMKPAMTYDIVSEVGRRGGGGRRRMKSTRRRYLKRVSHVRENNDPAWPLPR